MGRDFSEEIAPPSKVTLMGAALTFVYTLTFDIVLYTCIIPLIGTYVAGGCAKMYECSPKTELLLTIFVTFTLLYMTFCLFGEASYWKHLFEFEEFYCILLQVRDLINTVVLVVCLHGISSTVEAMIEDRAMKTVHVSEGAPYVFVRTILDWFNIDHSVLLSIGLTLPHKGTLTDPNFGENERFEHGASYMLLWAMLTACVAKLLYFNTLFTYLRAMEIFISLRPIFADDDDDSERESSMSSSFYRRIQSRLTQAS